MAKGEEEKKITKQIEEITIVTKKTLNGKINKRKEINAFSFLGG